MTERPTDIKLPDGWDWDRVERARLLWGINDNMVPVAVGGAGPCVAAWGTINSVRAEQKAGLRVNTYDIAADGTETLRSENVTLLDCFPDKDDEYYTAQRYLERDGRYWGGGGATPLFLIMRIRT